MIIVSSFNIFPATDSEKALLRKFIQPTMDLVEEAWRGEVTSTKRDRGLLVNSY